MTETLNLSEHVRRHLEAATLFPGRLLSLSLSGGLDSTVLLHLLAKLRDEGLYELEAVHFNFQLRGQDSEADEAFVRKRCGQLKVPLEVLRVDLKKTSAIQEQARDFRKSFIEQRKIADWVEAHHADDQIETFFLRLFRGAQIKGLAAMKSPYAWKSSKIWRPLLSVRKSELLTYAETEGIEFRSDSTNESNVYDRNFVRRELVPLIEERFPHALTSIQRSMEGFQKLDEDLTEIAESLRERLICVSPDYEWQWDEWLDLKPAVREECVHRYFIRDLGISLNQRQTLELCRGLTGRRGFTFNAPQDLLVRGVWNRRHRRIRFKAPQNRG